MKQTPNDIDIDLTSKNGIQGKEFGMRNSECGIRKTEDISRTDGGEWNAEIGIQKSPIG